MSSLLPSFTTTISWASVSAASCVVQRAQERGSVPRLVEHGDDRRDARAGLAAVGAWAGEATSEGHLRTTRGVFGVHVPPFPGDPGTARSHPPGRCLHTSGRAMQPRRGTEPAMTNATRSFPNLTPPAPRRAIPAPGPRRRGPRRPARRRRRHRQRLRPHPLPRLAARLRLLPRHEHRGAPRASSRCAPSGPIGRSPDGAAVERTFPVRPGRSPRRHPRPTRAAPAGGGATAPRRGPGSRPSGNPEPGSPASTFGLLGADEAERRLRLRLRELDQVVAGEAGVAVAGPVLPERGVHARRARGSRASRR